ncbi:MAG TPA: hypothetical protein VK985_08920 [Rariglobus sp.]|nr:hypothetical protein [Rariglobus sp.]
MNPYSLSVLPGIFWLGLITSGGLQGQTAAGPQILFADDFTGQSGAPTHWWFGNNVSFQGAADSEDTFAVVNNGTSDVLRFLDVAPVTSPSVPMFHTAEAVDFAATGHFVLRLDMDLKVNNNTPDYRVGLYNALYPQVACSSKAFQLRIFPGAETNNVSLLTFSDSGVVDNIVGTAPLSALRGAHRFTLELDFSTNGIRPTVRAYSDGVLIAKIVASPTGGFRRAGAEGKDVRIMAQSTSPGYKGTGTSFELDNVKLTALSAPLKD